MQSNKFRLLKILIPTIYAKINEILAYPKNITYNARLYKVCERGGIGRRAGFRYQYLMM